MTDLMGNPTLRQPPYEHFTQQMFQRWKIVNEFPV